MSWSEVKKINSDLNKPLDTLINEVKTNIGSNSSAASAAGDLHAKIKELRTLVDTLEGSLGQVGDAASANGTVNAKLRDLRSFVNTKSSIKSIQRGVVSAGTEKYINVNIAPVDISKCHVVLYGGTNISNNNNIGSSPGIYYEFFSNTILTIYRSAYNASHFSDNRYSWEVIEYA